MKKIIVSLEDLRSVNESCHLSIDSIERVKAQWKVRKCVIPLSVNSVQEKCTGKYIIWL